MKYLAFVTTFITLLSSICSAAPSVTVTRVEPQGHCGAYYDVVLDYDGSDSYDTHHEIGRQYAQAILDSYAGEDFEKTFSNFFRYNVLGFFFSGLFYPHFIDRVDDLMEKFDDPGDEFYLYGAEIEGMASVFNDVDNSHTNYDLLWVLFFEENQLSLKELFLVNLVSDVFSNNGCSTLSVWGDLTPDEDPALDGRPLVGKNTDFSAGALLRGCSGKVTSLHAVHYFKNQGDKKDMVLVGFLGCVLALEKGMNESGLFAGENISRYRENHYESRDKDSISAVLRSALESCDTVDEAKALVANGRSYTHGNLVTLVDTDRAQIVENSYLGSDVRAYDSELRTEPIGVITNPDTNPPEVWDYRDFEGPVLAATNSFQLPSQPENHRNPSLYRLGDIHAMTLALSDDGNITADDIMEVLTQNEPGEGSNNVFRTSDPTTLQSLVYDPRQQRLSVHFAPCPTVVKSPDIPEYTPITLGFINTP